MANQQEQDINQLLQVPRQIKGVTGKWKKSI